MIKTSKQLKDLIRNLSKKKAADAQMLMRHYMMERFLERISLSEYKDQFILKGGILVTAMIGLNARSTMDLDATVKGINVNAEDVEQIVASIASVPLDDGVSFYIKSIGEIMDEAEYPGIRVSIETKFDGVITPFKVDISTGDIITPKEIRYQLKLMLEERAIDIRAYNLETILAEKLETIIARNTTNTRMRDFYDIHSLLQLYGENMNPAVFNQALMATANKRGTEHYLTDMMLIVDEVENSSVMENLWLAYQKKFSYASDITWGSITESVRNCMGLIRMEGRH
ncbi:nucleotidyl transferase AbiEii/AbiGii toxin family protein [Acetobacterium malicum]|jgi:predicted nucleotidyltransferase component of viral defense system|uniref:Nucleotidyl transferase AbiEii/AbiGii toxin family protein n=2 Tax=Acetobacterium TaxID=33951 RepID=A0A5D0WN05_9FIRM|nr:MULTISPECIES: nucleotidyl transferase AbiEii/AbiGii toxin family protein [Acetobacterium]MBC3899991.1 nucleotidyl transferase AbiEii/AbiGii toxin family protein [Acetobacterium malicum]TYC85537.1 nucleotidyl transferase AbiEii/AbiGii toxin family protein [Acetobacterium wieringae]